MTDEKKMAIIGDGISKYNPIKDTTEKAGVVMPDIVAVGDLTVLDHDEHVKQQEEKFNKKDIPLPELGAKFMTGGHEYIVTYINPGQHRFTCEPCKGGY